MNEIETLDRLGADPNSTLEDLSGAEKEQLLNKLAAYKEMNANLSIGEPDDQPVPEPDKQPEPDQK